MLQSDTPVRAAKTVALMAQTTLFLCFLAFVPCLPAQTNFGAHKVGSPATGTVTVNSMSAGTVVTVEVLTSGAPNQDYIETSDTCSGMSFSGPGQICSVSVSFTPAAPGPRLGAVVLLDSSSNVLGSALLQGSGTGGLVTFSPPGVLTVAGGGYWSVVKDGGSALSAGLYLPSAVALDGAGNFYIADSQHHRVRMVSSGKGATIHHSVSYLQAGYIVTMAGNGNARWTGDGVAASDPSVSVNDPSGLAIDGAGNLYIADTGNNVIRRIDAASGIITTVAGNSSPGNSGDNGPATKASLNAPAGVSVDGVGNIYIADTGNHKIRAVCAPGTASLFGVTCGAAGNLIPLAGNGYTTASETGGFSGDNGPATAAELNFPYAPAFDAQGNMYIPDSGNNRVRRVDPTGKITTFAGTGLPGANGDGGPPTSAQLQTPTGLVIDPAQNVLICDSGNSAIRKVNALTKKITTEIRGNIEYYTGSKVAAVALYGSKGIALDQAGNLYVADTFGMHIREFPSNAALLDFTATPIFQGDTSGPLNKIIENDGNDTLTLSSVSTATNAAYDASDSTCISASPLSVDAQCVIAAEFAPTSAGNPVVGTLTIDGQTINTPLTLTIAGAATANNSTSVAIISSQNPVPYAQSLTISATVTTGKGTGTPTGTLAFYDGTKILQGAVGLNALGSGSFTVSTLSVRTHNITAAYSGDSAHTSSTSYPMVQQVTEPTAVTLTARANPALVGSSVTLTAQLSTPSGGGVTPDGLVAFFDGSSLLGTSSANSSGTAILTLSSLSQGPHTLTVQYGGDTSKFIDSSNSAKLALNVVANSALTVTSSANPSTFGVPVTLTATVSTASTVVPTGSITFFDGGQSIGTGDLGSGGVATVAVNSFAVGAHTITASYPGDQNVHASTSTAISQTVTGANTATVLSVNPAQPAAGTSVTLTASVSPVSGPGSIGGTVTFSDGAAPLGTAPVGANGKASLATTLSAGSHTLKAAYGGDGDNTASASAPVALTVSAAATDEAQPSSASAAQVLTSVVFTASVVGNGAPPTGSITFKVDGTATAPVSVDGSGNASFTDSVLPVGNHTIVAVYSGDANNLASSSAALSQAINAIPTRTLLNTSSTGGSNPQPILVASVVADSSPIPSGTVTFTAGSTVIGAVALDAAGVATFVPELPPNTYDIVASYGGDTDHASSASSSVSVTGTVTEFAVAVTPSSVTMAAAQSAIVNIVLTSSRGYSDTIEMGCLGLPANAICHFSSPSVQLQGGQATKVQVVIEGQLLGTTAAISKSDGSSLDAAFILPGGLLGVLIWRRKLRLKGILAALLALVVFVGFSGCGSNITLAKAAPGTYNVKIGGTGKNTGVAFFQNVTLTIK